MKKIGLLLIMLLVGMSTTFAQKVKPEVKKVKAELYLPDNILVADVYDFIGYNDVEMTNESGTIIAVQAGFIITLTFIPTSEEDAVKYRNLLKENTDCSVKLKWDDVYIGNKGKCYISEVTEENLVFNAVLLGDNIVKVGKF